MVRCAAASILHITPLKLLLLQMRAGTQTLIQALQALPWSQAGDDDDIFNGGDSSSEEDEPSDDGWLLPLFPTTLALSSLSAVVQLASSIHTIHRPLTRSRYRNASVPLQVEEEDTSNPEPSDEAENEDFERTPRPPHVRPPHVTHFSFPESAVENEGATGGFPRVKPTRAGSMATVRLQRRAGLAKKLKEVFELDAIVPYSDHITFLSFLLIERIEMPCWILRSIRKT
jgi:sterol 3beta-glucosyltransferase